MQIDSSLRANIRSLAAIHLILKYVHMQINAHTAVYKRKVGALKYTHTHNCTYAHLAKNLLKISSCYQQFPANRHPDAVPHRTTSRWAGARENPLTLSFCSAFACFFCSFQYRALGSLCRLRCATTAIDMYLAYVACHCCLSIDNLFMCNPQWICQNTEIFQVHLHLHFCSSVLLLLHLLLCFYSPFALFIAATWSVAYRWGVCVCVCECMHMHFYYYKYRYFYICHYLLLFFSFCVALVPSSSSVLVWICAELPSLAFGCALLCVYISVLFCAFTSFLAVGFSHRRILMHISFAYHYLHNKSPSTILLHINTCNNTFWIRWQTPTTHLHTHAYISY